jgi:nitrous oxidase accessory protein NosD
VRRFRLVLSAALLAIPLLLTTGLPGCPTRPAVANDPEEPLAVRAGAAIDSLLDSTADGGTLILPRARYRIDRPIVLNRPIILRGEPGTVLELCPGSSTSLIEVHAPPGVPGVARVEIEDLTLEGNREDQRAGSGITILSAAHCAFRRLVIRSCWLDGVYCSNVRDCLFEEIRIEGCGRNGLSFGEAIRDSVSAGNQIVRCTSIANGLIGFDVEPGVRNLFDDCEARGNLTYGFSVGARERSRLNTIRNCRSTSNGSSGVNIWSDENSVENCTSLWNGEDGVSVIGPIATGNRVTGCRVERNARHGIGLDRTTGSVVADNVAVDNGAVKPGNGIAVVAGVPVYDNFLRGNHVSGASHRYALVVTEQVHRTVLEGNDLSGRLLIAAEDVTWR